MHRKLISLLAVLSWLCGVAFAADPPERSKGISIHMLPKQAADLGGKRWGLTVDYAPFLEPEPEQPVLQTEQEFLAFVRKQDKAVVENGIWIVTTNPGAYSASEMKLLDGIEGLCRREKIPLFVVRAAELPNGWKRYDQ